MQKIFIPLMVFIVLFVFFSAELSIAQALEKKRSQESTSGEKHTKVQRAFWVRIHTKNVNLLQDDESLSQKIPSEIMASLGPFLEQVKGSPDVTLLASDTSFYLVVSCSFEVHQWEKGAWKNLYQYDNYGYTCNSYFFQKDGEISALGSNGFWNAQADWLVFDKTFGSWKLIKTQNQPLGYSTYFKGIGPSYAYFLHAKYRNNRVEDYTLVANKSFVLDFESNRWHEVDFGKYYSFNPKQTPYFIDKEDEYAMSTENYMVTFATRSSDGLNGFLMLDKADWQLKFVASPIPFSDYKFAYWRMIEGDEVQYLSSLNRKVSLDIESIYDQAEPVGQLKIIQEEKIVSPLSSSLILLFVNLIVLLVAIVFYRKWKVAKRANPANDRTSDAGTFNMNGVAISALYDQVLAQQVPLLSIDELDELLGIEAFKNIDSRKATRARMLKKINEYAKSTQGKPLITRKRSHEDRRKYVYRIAKNSA